MLNPNTFHKTLLALVISASISACNGSVSSDKTDVSVGDNPSETNELSSYGTPAEKADLFSSYTGVLGDNLADPSVPSYDRTVYINLSDMTVSADDVSYFSIAEYGDTAAGDGIVITADSDGYITVNAEECRDTVKYVLSGTLSRGTVDISAVKKASLGIVLNNVDIMSGNNPAITVSPKTSTAFVELKGTSYLTDGRIFGIGYSSSNGKDYYDSSVDSSVDVSDAALTQKWAKGSDDNGVMATKGTFRFSGDGILNVSSAYKHGIYAKNRIYVYGGEIGVKNSGRSGIQSKNGYDMFGGTVNIEGTGNHTNSQSRGIIVSGDESKDGAGLGGINIEGGVININTVGKAMSAKWSLKTDAETEETTDDPNPVVTISGGDINITTTGVVIDDDKDQHDVTYYDEDGILVTETESASPEGIEGKMGLVISGGNINVNSADDALNTSIKYDSYINISGGNIYLRTTEGDAVDSNGSINVSGGVIVGISILGTEHGFDCDGKLTFTGGLAIGISGSEKEFASTGADTTTQNTFVIGNGYIGEQNTVMAVKNSSGEPVFAARLPETPYSLAVITAPALAGSDTYSVYTGVNVSGGTEFNGLYTEMPQVSGGSLKGSVIVTDDAHVYNLTQSNAN